MRNRFFLIFLCTFFFASVGHSQEDTIKRRFYLVGDAGELKDGKHPVCDWLTTHIKGDIIYLGDNIYPNGMPNQGERGYEEAKKIIDYQISVIKEKPSHAWFVQGNHDWKRGKPGGWQRAKNVSDYVNSLGMDNVKLFPEGGCPGPFEVNVGDNIVLVLFDSQWWLNQTEKPGPDSDCDTKTTEEVIAKLKEIVNRNKDKLLIMAMHHPLYTNGPHGGHFTLKQHIFPFTELNDNFYIPLPVLGSIYPIARGVFGNIQDTKHPIYRKMISSIEGVLKTHPHVLQVAGHDHALQFLQHDGVNYIVSGAGAKKELVRKHGKNSLFESTVPGFAEIDLSVNGFVTVRYFRIKDGNAEQIFTKQLFQMPASAPLATFTDLNLPDSILIPASTRYNKASHSHRWWLGNNYREEWAIPVKVGVFNIKNKGLHVTQRGGGLQSKSLRLEDSSGKEFVLRSIEKFPESAVPEDLRETFAKDIFQDQISASHPYAALTVPPMATAANVPHAVPIVVYVPDDPELGIYRDEFKNQLFLFEEREPVKNGKTYSTIKMVEKLQSDNDNEVDEKAVLQARLLDMFISDWDRHDDQWRWGVEAKKKKTEYFPIPRDRDQAYFVNEGVLPRIVSSSWLQPKFQGFRKYIPNIRGFNFNGRYFDRSFLTGIDAKHWEKQANEFVAQMTDSILQASVNAMPNDINKFSGTEILEKLKARRNILVKESMTYYRFISRAVDIIGSEKRDLFIVDRKNNGNVKVEVFKISKSGNVEHKMFEREFEKGITKEIRLYGFGGNDSFQVKGSPVNAIAIRIIGGAGDDVYQNESGKGAVRVYDLSNEKNEFIGSGDFRKHLSSDPAINNYDRKAFKYNVLAPLLSAGFNPDDGLFLGAGFKYTTNKFRRTPATIHKFTVNHSLATNAFNIKYNAAFYKVIGKADILFSSDIKAPDNVLNFFGFGNSSIFDKGQAGKIRYYRTRYNLADFSLLLRRKISSTLSLSVGPAFQHYNIDSSDNNGRFIITAPANGLDPATLFKEKNYLGGQFLVSVDDRNNKVLPTRGINWQTSLKRLFGTNEVSRSVTQLNSDLAVYISLATPATVVLATRIGAGINWGKPEFFQAQYLGGTENLRGYRKYRFAGKSMLFSNTDLRIKIADFRTYLFPGSIGVLVFYDAGKVWVPNDSAGSWRSGYGAGLWVAPLKLLVITASVARSEEGTLPLVSIGYQF